MSGSPSVQALNRYQAGFASRGIGQQPRRVAELAGRGSVHPGEPVDAADPPAAAVADQQREGLVQLLCLPVHPPLPARLAAVGAPTQLGDVQRRGAVVVDAHDAAEVLDLGAHRAGIGHVGVQRHPVEEPLDGLRPVEAAEEIPGRHVGRDLQRTAEQPAEDHLGAGIGPVQHPPGDPHQPGEALGVGALREGDDVLLVPDLPAADRQEGQVRVLRPERAARAVAVHGLPQERRPLPPLPGALHRQGDRAGRHPAGAAPHEREDPEPVVRRRGRPHGRSRTSPVPRRRGPASPPRPSRAAA